MGTIRNVDQNSLDDRMTDETKTYVKTFLSTTDPRAILDIDLKLVRHMKDANAKMINNKLRFDDLDEKEYFVDSLYDGHKIPVTAYVPKELNPNSSLVIFYHGGAGCLGTRLTYHHTTAALAQLTQCIWLSIDYRLAPEAKFPTGQNDCLSVTKWAISQKMSFFGLNENSDVGLCGESFGGTVSASISHELKSEISFQILVYPMVDTTLETKSKNEFHQDCYILIPDVIDFFAKNLLSCDTDVHDIRLSPYRNNDFSQYPRTLIIAAELDYLRDHSKIYHEKLIENNVSSELHILNGLIHGFFNVPHAIPNGFSKAAELIMRFMDLNRS